MEENKNKIDELEKLRRIGVEKIREDTKIDTLKITDILQKRFDRLDCVRARGFIHILEKQYGLDLSSWLEEYYQNQPKEEQEEQQKALENEKRYLKRTNQKQIIASAIFVLFLGFLLVLSWIIFDHKTTQPQQEFQAPQSTQDLNQEPQSQTIQSEVPQSEVSSLDENSSQTPKETENSTLGNQIQTKKQINQTQEKGSDENQSKQPQVIARPLSEIGTPLFQNQENVTRLSLAFKRPVWVGMINLQNKQRIASTKDSFDFELQGKLLFYIAYGMCVLGADEQQKEFKTYDPIFLAYTQEGGLRQISKEEFVFFNGGVQW